MKKLNKIVLKKATIMTAPEMKHISGGYDAGCSGDAVSFSCTCEKGKKEGCGSDFDICASVSSEIISAINERCIDGLGTCSNKN